MNPSSLVLTPVAALPSRQALEAAGKELLKGELRWEASDTEGTLCLDDLRVRVALRPTPVANAEADTAAFLSLSSLKDNWRLPGHGAHLVVERLGGGEVTRSRGLLGRVLGSQRPATALESLSRFTRMVATVTRAANALGVYWGAGPVTHEPRFFVDLAREAEVPLPLWLGVTITPEPGERVTVLSMGMKQLGLPDLLLGAPRKELGDTLDFFYSTLTFVAERGEALPDGHVVPRSLLERLTARYVPSPLDERVQVVRLELR